MKGASAIVGNSNKLILSKYLGWHFTLDHSMKHGGVRNCVTMSVTDHLIVIVEEGEKSQNMYFL